MHRIATKTQDNIITSPQKQIIENDRNKVIQSLAVSQSQLIFFYWKGTAIYQTGNNDCYYFSSFLVHLFLHLSI